MSVQRHLDDPGSYWMDGTGDAADVAVSTRVRLARNLANFPFPDHLDPARAEQVVRRVEAATARLGEEWERLTMADLTPVDRQVLVEKHLISPELAQGRPGAALLVLRDESQSIMVNEEDHLRLQCLVPGLQLENAWRLVSRTDDRLEEQLDYAFDPEKGYLTACPTNLGTGMRASVMMHLPGLVRAGQMPRVAQALTKLGLTVRGLHGEGSEAVGDLFQVSNQVTLGLSEEEILRHLSGVAAQIIGQERAARQAWANDNLLELQDRVGRAYGLLRHARLMDVREAMSLLSDLRLGVEVGLWQGIGPRVLNELLVICLPGFLERKAGRSLTETERRALRASMIRERLKASEGGR